MLLSARILDDVANVNNFDYTEAAEFTDGDTPSVYFQIIDTTEEKALDGFKPAGRRYMPAAGATLSVTFDSVDADKKLVRTATQPFVQDPSIWKVDVLSTDAGKIKGTVTLRLVLTEGAKVTKGSARAAVRVCEAH